MVVLLQLLVVRIFPDVCVRRVKMTAAGVNIKSAMVSELLL